VSGSKKKGITSLSPRGTCKEGAVVLAHARGNAGKESLQPGTEVKEKERRAAPARWDQRKKGRRSPLSLQKRGALRKPLRTRRKSNRKGGTPGGGGIVILREEEVRCLILGGKEAAKKDS